MSDDLFTCGTIYWPLLSLDILRSEMVPFLSAKDLEKENEIRCPFCIEKTKCSYPGNNDVLCFMNENNRQACCYYKYHKFFLLIKDSVTFRKCIEYVDPEPANQNSYSNIYDSNMSVDDFSKTLCYFPQYKLVVDELIGFKYVGKGHPQKYFFEHNGDHVDLPDIKNVNKLKPRAKLYAKSEYHLTQNKTDSTTSSSAFNKLIKIDAIKSRLPKDEFEVAQSGKPSIHPVTLSFFADKSADALLSLVMDDDGKESCDETRTLVEQALGSIHNEIYTRRQEFLENWCMTLGERVDDIYQKEIIVRSNDADKTKYVSDDEKRQKEAKKEAMQFAFKAICEMVKILAVQESDGFPENASQQFIYNPKKQPSGQISTYIEKYYDKLGHISSDRKEYVNEFCKKAEMYAEEFVSSEGKLKGRLSAPTVKKLKNISQTSNPVNARILIQGEAGGGKGVTADDFHFYCMKRIANQKKYKDNYLKEVEKSLDTIFELPANYNTVEMGAGANLFFSQISNTGWWLWDRPIDKKKIKSKPIIAQHEKLTTLISAFDKKQKETIDYLEKTSSSKSDFFSKTGEGSQKKLINMFVNLLKNKIAFENAIEKSDFSFNLLQVNCGILGGENRELSESIARLFGTSGDYKTAMPGLFQTCSYMGGTLFLDEIADAPVRVQDNLLRPLEEGTVSRPGWETFDEKVDNIRIVGATFKALFKLAQQYQETLPSGHPKGFRPDLLTRLTRNTPVAVSPVWHYFVPTKSVDDDFPSQFAFVLNNSGEVSTDFWRKVYFMVSKQIDEHVFKARHHIPAGPEGRRKFASKLTMRLFKEVGKIARLNSDPEKPDENDPQINSALVYLRRMLDYLLVETS